MSEGYRTSEDLRRFFELFRRADDSSVIELPDLITGFLQPVFDAMTWARIQQRDMDSEEQSAFNVTEVQSTVVPAGESRLFLAASAFHDDGGANHTLTIEYTRPGAAAGTSPALVNSVSLASAEMIAIPRPVLVPAGGNLNVLSLDAVGVGNTLRLRSAWVVLRPGEYLPGAPFG